MKNKINYILNKKKSLKLQMMIMKKKKKKKKQKKTIFSVYINIKIQLIRFVQERVKAIFTTKSNRT